VIGDGAGHDHTAVEPDRRESRGHLGFMFLVGIRDRMFGGYGPLFSELFPTTIRGIPQWVPHINLARGDCSSDGRGDCPHRTVVRTGWRDHFVGRRCFATFPRVPGLLGPFPKQGAEARLDRQWVNVTYAPRVCLLGTLGIMDRKVEGALSRIPSLRRR